MGFDKFTLFKPYARIFEQLEAAKLQSAAQQQLGEQQAVAAEETAPQV